MYIHIARGYSKTAFLDTIWAKTTKFDNTMVDEDVQKQKHPYVSIAAYK